MMDLHEAPLLEKSAQAEENITTENVSLPETAKENKLVENKLSREEIVARVKELVDQPVESVKDEIDSLKQNYYKLRKNEVEEARRKFEEETGDTSGFTPEPDECEETLKGLLNVFKEKKAKLLEQQEKVKEENLLRKKSILEEIKKITEDSDNINKHYNDFQQLQQAFKEITDVPASAVNELWKNYQLYVEHFYDLLKINKELRDYDFKKNLDLKLAICESAEALAKNDDVVAAFKSLQTLHDEWRAIGPVAKELREDLWNRFKAASTVINKAHQQHFEILKADEQKNEAAKIAICEEIEAIDMTALKSFSAWDEKTKDIIALQERWKGIGFASRKVNNALFERFRKTCDEFFKQKAEYFKRVKDEMSLNLEKKKALCEKAEALKDSTDWKNTTDQMIAIQKEWKTIGPVAKKYSDAVWTRFIAACDYFFENKNKNTTNVRQAEHNNLKAKKAVVEKLKNIDENLPKDEIRKLLKALSTEFQEIGHVPYKEKDKVYEEYKKALNAAYDKFDINESRARFESYASNVEELAGDKNRLFREREKLVRMYEQKRNEIKTYENNLGFFNATTKSGGSVLKEMERRIARLKEELLTLEKKIELIDEKL